LIGAAPARLPPADCNQISDASLYLFTSQGDIVQATYNDALYQTVNPTTGEALKRFSVMTDVEISSALQTADECYQHDWRLRPVAERCAVVARAAAMLREKAEEYAQIMTLEMGKLIDHARYEVNISADILDYYAANAEAFLKTQPVPGAPNSVLETEPIGVIFGIEPWNFPYYQLARVAGPQLTAGNVVLIKHAPNVPQCALAFAKLFEEAGAPQGAYTNLFASNEQAAQLIDDFRVRGVTLTGSERAGSAVAERAGRALKKSVLELGGSDPFVVLEDAPIDQAVTAGFQGRMVCMGQACIASKRFIVVGKARGEQFLAGLLEQIGELKCGDPADSTTTLGPLVSERALEGLLNQIHVAREHGAQIVTGGKRMDRAGFYLEPTVITGISPSNPLYGQEAFGPVLSFYVVETEDEAVKLANDTPFGLGASVFGEDMERVNRVARRLDCGMVFLNSGPYSGPESPFGGVKNSGYGREMAELGFGEFVNRKLIRTA
jgi:succinate-semialdehyde dehydrogenase / glutarate-semialdehyde dehydrogenase